MTDLTKITTPFGLLDSVTQSQLKEHGGVYEFFTERGWQTILKPSWIMNAVYRVQPLPKTKVLYLSRRMEGASDKPDYEFTYAKITLIERDGVFDELAKVEMVCPAQT